MNPIEAITEVSKSALNKTSSPLLGAFVTSWLVINWKIIFILFMSKETIEKVITSIESNYFNINVMLYYPLTFSVLYVIGSPWMNVITTWIMSEADKYKAKIVLKRDIEINQMLREKSLTNPKLKFPYSEIEEIMATAIVNMTQSEKRRFITAVNSTADESIKFGQF